MENVEKRKLLLVAVSVGVFLVIIVSASILILTPKTVPGTPGVRTALYTGNASGKPIAPGAEGIPQPATVDAANLVRNTDELSMQSPPSATAIQETTFYINGVQPVESYQIEKADGDASAKVVINVPPARTAGVPDATTPAAKPAEPKPAAPKPVETVAAPKPAPAQTPKPAATTAAAKPAAPAATAKPAATTTAAKPQPQTTTKTFRSYWVQTGAFSNKSNAEGVKQTLASKGIASIIENREMDGKTIYQVRVGPYTSENEANYWLALVKSIDGFGNSQIRQSTSMR